MDKVTELPDGFQFTYNDIQPEEINELRQKFGWNPDSEERWQECLDESIVVGVRHSQKLIGIGFIAGNSRHGVLCDLSIDPEYKEFGLAEVIIHETLRIAKRKGMRYFYLHMSPPFLMREEYLKLGFQDTGGSLFRNDTLKAQ